MKHYRFRVVSLFLVCYLGVMGVILSQMGKSLIVSSSLSEDPVIILDAGHLE